MIAMHVPDGLLSPGAALGCAILAVVIIGRSLSQTNRSLRERQVPLAGLTAAFVFAAQMVNIPIAAGTSGHLLGGALAAILLGPYVASVVLTVVVVAQSLIFADGGITAIGVNVINLAVVSTFGGWAAFVLLRRLLGNSRGGLTASGGLAAAASVVLSAMAFSIEWLVGATAPVPFDTVFAAMVGVHIVIGIGEGVITAFALGAVLATRPDLVTGVDDVDQLLDGATRRQPVTTRTFVVGATMISVAIAAIASQFASTAPDGLERVAADQQLGATSGSGWRGAILSEYAVAGIDHPAVSLAIAGIAGVVIVTGVTFAMMHARRSAPRRTRTRVST